MQRDEDTLGDRKKSQEAKYKMDEERRFKVRARRNKLLGLWIARHLGLAEEGKAEFAREVVMAGLDARSDDDLLARLVETVAGRGGSLEPCELAAELGRCAQEAESQIAAEFPAALDGDHAPVGDPPHRK